MYTKEQIQFNEEFKAIVRQHALLDKNSKLLRQLAVWDDMGSHHKATLKAVDQREILKKDLHSMLKGLDYLDWQLASKLLHRLNSRLKAAITLKENCEKKLAELDFGFLNKKQ